MGALGSVKDVMGQLVGHGRCGMAETPATALGLSPGGLVIQRVTHQGRSVKPKAILIVKGVQQQRVGELLDMLDMLMSSM